MGEVLRAGRADGLAACSIVDFVQAPTSGARAQLRRDRSSGNPAPRSLRCICITFRPHLYCKCIAWPQRKEVAASLCKLSGAGPRFRLVGSSGVLIAFDARDERTRRRVAPGQDRRLAGQAQRAGSEARPLKIRASSAYFE